MVSSGLWSLIIALLLVQFSSGVRVHTRHTVAKRAALLRHEVANAKDSDDSDDNDDDDSDDDDDTDGAALLQNATNGSKKVAHSVSNATKKNTSQPHVQIKNQTKVPQLVAHSAKQTTKVKNVSRQLSRGNVTKHTTVKASKKLRVATPVTQNSTVAATKTKHPTKKALQALLTHRTKNGTTTTATIKNATKANVSKPVVKNAANATKKMALGQHVNRTVTHKTKAAVKVAKKVAKKAAPKSKAMAKAAKKVAAAPAAPQATKARKPEVQHTEVVVQDADNSDDDSPDEGHTLSLSDKQAAQYEAAFAAQQKAQEEKDMAEARAEEEADQQRAAAKRSYDSEGAAEDEDGSGGGVWGIRRI